MKIAIASDHGGFNLKKRLIEYLKNNYEVVDFGCETQDSCDYPIYAKKVVDAILNKGFSKGILICGTGVGMAICANRFKGIRAVNTTEVSVAKLSREHNNSNVLTLGERIIDEKKALEIVDVWLNTEFQEGRHKRRIDMLDE